MFGMMRTTFESVATRLALVLVIMGAMTAMAITVASLVFEHTVSGLQEMSRDKLPRMTQSSNLIIDSNAIKDGIAAILVATSNAEIESLAGGIEGQLELLEFRVAEAGPEILERLGGKVQTLRSDVARLKAARQTEFQSANAVATTVARMEDMADDVTRQITERTEAAHLSLANGSRETASSVDSTLKQIVNVNVEGLRLVLQARAEINLLSGMAISYAETSDDALASIISNLSQAALVRLDRALRELSAIEALAVDTDGLGKAAEFFRDLLRLNRTAAFARRGEVLNVRQKSDRILSSVIDDLMAGLTANSANATESNANSIAALLTGQVEDLRSLAILEATLERVLADAFAAVSARDAAGLSDADEKLQASAAALADIAKTIPPPLAESIGEILRLAVGSQGVVALQTRVFQDRDAAVTASQAAAKSVLEAANSAAAIGAESGSDIVESAILLDARANTAMRWMTGIAAGSLAIFFAALALTYISVIRPILALCSTTERLAAGDLGEVTGPEHGTGEVARMANALKVFRDNLVKKLELEREDTARLARDAQAARVAEEERMARETAERDRIAADTKAQAERDAKAAADREALRQVADEERRQRMAEQERVVSDLAVALNRLSEGDLDAEIVDAFPGAYEKLRLDFNRAAATLSNLVGELACEGDSMDLSLRELSSASESLATRTEHSAARLEETAASIDKLTESVKSAADDAVSANSAALNASQRAENGREVIDEAIAAMQKIEQSSVGITAVTDLINDIAHQTNLLALNASVEAARAGDAGRGFAVVASEVRELARRSAEAAKKIDSLLAKSQQNVSLGSELVTKTGEALKSISVSASETNDMVVRIKTSAQRQAESIADINTTVTALDQATQENAAMFEETSSLVTALSASSSKLAHAISRFKVKGWATRPEPESKAGSKAASSIPSGGTTTIVSPGEPICDGRFVANGTTGVWDEF